MATLNLSTNGPSIKSSYQKVVESAPPSGASAASSTYGQWVVYTVQAPLVSAFQNDLSKESVLKVQSTGEGELLDLIEEFSDGRIQFAFAKVKDPNSGLPKSVLIAWCGEGVPERTKGYFTSHLAAVSKLLHGYHVQVTARSDRDLTPETIISKVADSSGAKYGGAPASSVPASKPPPPATNKPFLPNKVGGAGGFAPLGSSRARTAETSSNQAGDGWGEDAPEPTRRQLEKVESAYKPTKVNLTDLTSQRQEPSRFSAPAQSEERGDVVKGGYQPIGKVDLAAIRREAKEKGEVKDDRPSIVKGSYEPIGKVDIAAIRAKAQGAPSPSAPPPAEDDERPKSLADRSAAFQAQERMTSLPKPKVANKFGGSSNFTGTKAPTPGFLGTSSSSTPQVGSAGRSFAEGAGKSPAQLWAEKKAREGGSTPSAQPPSASPVPAQKSGGWQSGYAGKKWDSVQITKTGTSHVSAEPDEPAAAEEEEQESGAGFGAARDKFSAAPPPLDNSSKPNAGARGVPMPGLPSRLATNDRPQEEHVDLPSPPPQPRSPSPEPSTSPVRIAMPVSRTNEPAEIETQEPEPIPTASLAKVASQSEPEPESQAYDDDDGRGASQAAAQSSFGTAATAAPTSSAGKKAVVQYDYEKAEDNELELKEGELVLNIEMVDEDWWLGENSKGEKGLFPSNYVELIAEDEEASGPALLQPQEASSAPAAGPPGGQGLPTATAQYDYEAAEDNELSFPDGAKITDVEFPDEDWWLGKYNGKQGLFPANHVQLDQ